MIPTPGYPGHPGGGDRPPSPGVEATISTALSNPEPPESDGLQLSAEDMAVEPEQAGPSSTYIPRHPSPPLPSFKREKYPGHDHDSDDSDDEVLTTLPIYITPSLSPNLNLFQYPLHHRSLLPPTWAKDRGKFITARIKEKYEGRVEIEIPVDEGGDVWRGEKARDMGFVMDVNDGEDIEGGTWGRRDKEKEGKGGKKKNRIEKAPERWGEKMRLRSEVVPNAPNYYSGVIHDGELDHILYYYQANICVGALHLHPVNKIMQFRTSLQYVDEMKNDPTNAQSEQNRMDAIKPSTTLRPGQRVSSIRSGDFIGQSIDKFLGCVR